MRTDDINIENNNIRERNARLGQALINAPNNGRDIQKIELITVDDDQYWRVHYYVADNHGPNA